jgi:2-polyprenyl-3-methyl-5-hydroxy-6-metoxy-1,4-benzoquinol methylase
MNHNRKSGEKVEFKMPGNRYWKARAYNAYVSSGQAGNPDDLINSRLPYIELIIRKYIPFDPNLQILDLGCGYGAFLYVLKQAGFQRIAGIDTSLEQVALAHNLGVTEVEHGDIMSFLKRHNKETTDIVLLMDVIEHLTRQEIFDMLDEVFKVLRVGGKCIVHVPNAEGLFGVRVRYGDITHELAFTPKSAHQLFSTVGFHQIQCIEDRPLVHSLKSFLRRCIWDTMTLAPRLLLAAETGSGASILSQNMLVVCKK